MFLKKYGQQARQELNIQPSEKPVKGANIQRAMWNGKLWRYRMVEGGGKLGEPIKPLCPGTRCQLDFEELHTCQHPGIPNTKREGALCVYY